VFNGEGLDALPTNGRSHVYDVDRGAVTEYDVDPDALGLRPAGPDDLRGGEAELNATLVREILDGAAGPRRDVVLLNAAAGLVAAGLAIDLAAGIEAAAAAVDGGGARRALGELVEVSQGLAAQPAR